MIFDFLRSHHFVRCKITSDGAEEVMVRWYPTAPGARPFPGWTCFGSAIWEGSGKDVYPFSGAGMEREPLQWAPKAFPAPAGTHYHGKREWFETGVPAEEFSSPSFPVDPSCRVAPPLGGVVVGGRSTVGTFSAGGAIVGGTATGPAQGGLAVGGVSISPPTGGVLVGGSSLGRLSGGILIGGQEIDLPAGGIIVGGTAAMAPAGGVLVGGESRAIAGGGVLVGGEPMEMPMGGIAVGGESVDGVMTDCCTNPIPFRLQVDISSLGGCTCMEGTSEIAWNGERWTGETARCAGTLTLQLRCSGTTLLFILLCNGTLWHANSPLSGQCDPFDFTFHLGASGFGCCDGTIEVRVTPA